METRGLWGLVQKLLSRRAVFGRANGAARDHPPTHRAVATQCSYQKAPGRSPQGKKRGATDMEYTTYFQYHFSFKGASIQQQVINLLINSIPKVYYAHVHV